MQSRKQHPAELRERAVAMVFELRAASGSAAVCIIAVSDQAGKGAEPASDMEECFGRAAAPARQRKRNQQRDSDAGSRDGLRRACEHGA